MNKCIVVVTGYYEWTKEKQPYAFCKSDKSLIYIAGLYNESGIVLMTKEANDDVNIVHHRMPVMLNTKTDFEAWL